MNESAEAQVLNNEPKEPVGFIFNDFLTPEDIQILNADTTQISISKELADKKGIDNFVNRPMGIWLNLREASFLRRGTKQTLAGDRYIIDVVKAELAEVLPIGKDITLKTDVYVNPEALVNTATRGDEGKDLSQVKYVVGTGGALTRLPHREHLLRQMADMNQNGAMLFPKPGEAALLFDNDYIMASLGVLSKAFPKEALTLMKRSMGL
jgi:hypothetical protein